MCTLYTWKSHLFHQISERRFGSETHERKGSVEEFYQTTLQDFPKLSVWSNNAMMIACLYFGNLCWLWWWLLNGMHRWCLLTLFCLILDRVAENSFKSSVKPRFVTTISIVSSAVFIYLSIRFLSSLMCNVFRHWRAHWGYSWLVGCGVANTDCNFRQTTLCLIRIASLVVIAVIFGRCNWSCFS